MFYWVLLSKKEKTVLIEYDGSGLIFTNSGPPIRPETATMLFRPFFSTKDEGRGLGLFLSRESMKAIEGDLVLEKLGDKDGLGGPVFKVIISEVDQGVKK